MVERCGMETPEADPEEKTADPEPTKEDGRGWIVRALRAGGTVPGYYLDGKGRVRKGTVATTDQVVAAMVVAEAVSEEKPPDPFDQYEAMRHVLAFAAKKDVTPGQKYCRAWAERKPDDFMAAFSVLRAEREKESGPEGVESPPEGGSASGGREEPWEPDEGDEAIAALIAECLARSEESERPGGTPAGPRGSPGSGPGVRK